MAVTHLEELCQKLLKRERFTEATPAALIYKGTTADQRVVLGTLADIHIKKEQENIMPPSILVVGEVAKLSESLDWWHQRPLSGRRIALLRQKSKSQEFVETLEHLGAEVMVCPMLVVKAEPQAQEQISKEYLNPITDIIFTSQNGVETFFESCYSKGFDARVLANKKIVAVGPKTAAKCKQYGIQPDAIPETFQADAIPSVLEEDLSGRHLLFPVGKKARPSLPKACAERGATCSVLHIYDTHMPPSPQLSLRDGDDVIFTSPSIVNHAIESGVWDNQTFRAFSIGPVTTKALKNSGKQVEIIEADPYTMDGVLDAIMAS
jgi:uroporphyrinogen III methyltransferase/synthase